jgi:hypothetical protein
VVPPYTPDWAEAGGRETFAEGLRGYLTEIDVHEAREGDVVLFRWRAHLPAKHAGILTAPDRMVHAQERARVSEVFLSGWWRRRMAYAFALFREKDDRADNISRSCVAAVLKSRNMQSVSARRNLSMTTSSTAW